MSGHTIVSNSWRSIFAVALPIVLSNFSGSLMLMIDRIMITAHSIDALNAVSVSGNLIAVFTFLFIGITDCAEVYVGQYNGAKNHDLLASPMWQMFYFSVGTAIVFFPMAYFSDSFNLLPQYYMKDGVTYQRIMMYGGPLFPMFTALGAYFVGQGRAKVVTFAVVCGAILNATFNYLLIFGVEGVIPCLGVAGAAISTIISQVAQNLILLAVIFSPKERGITFKSFKFNKSVFLGCIKIGVPLSASNFLVLLAWYFVQSILSNTSKEEATIYSICLSIYLLALSTGEGLCKATSTVVANIIGRGGIEEAKVAFRRFLKLALVSSVIIVLPMSIAPDTCVFSLLEMLREDVSPIYGPLRICLLWMSFDVVLESLLSILWGVLVAGGDTRYPTMAYQSCIWGFVVTPAVICFLCGIAVSTKFIYQMAFLWLVASLWLFYRRYAGMKWYKKLV